MKQFVIILLSFTLFHQAYSQKAGNLQAYLYYTTFLSPTDGPYVETYLSVVGQSVKFVRGTSGRYQGSVSVTVIFRQGEEIVDFAKYELLSPEIEDTTQVNFNFLDQHRYLLSNGKYDMEIIIADQNRKVKPYITTEPILIDFPGDKVSISGIELLESFERSEKPSVINKGGFDLIPYVHNFFPQDVNRMMFYAEIYNSALAFGQGGPFLLSWYIESFETRSKLEKFVRNKRETAKEVIAILGEFDIADLPSGNYNLVIEIRDKENNSITSNQLFFQRSNPNVEYNLSDLAALSIENTFAGKITNEDTLNQYIKYLSPIATDLERGFINKQMKTSDLVTKQRFFLNFWMTRDNLNPDQAWEYYLGQVAKVNHSFGAIARQGYDTDRGRVYLKYGPPNIISQSYNEPAAYPYEIWQYYTLGNNQRNKKFVFYTEDIVTNEFQLVHSDAIGEISNYRWQVMIYRRTYDPENLDQGQYFDAWGSKVNQYYDNPY